MSMQSGCPRDGYQGGGQGWVPGPYPVRADIALYIVYGRGGACPRPGPDFYAIRDSLTSRGTISRAAPSSALFLPPPCADSGLPPPLPPRRSPMAPAILPACRPRFVNSGETLTCKPTRSSKLPASTTTPRLPSLSHTTSP